MIWQNRLFWLICFQSVGFHACPFCRLGCFPVPKSSYPLKISLILLNLTITPHPSSITIHRLCVRETDSHRRMPSGPGEKHSLVAGWDSDSDGLMLSLDTPKDLALVPILRAYTIVVIKYFEYHLWQSPCWYHILFIKRQSLMLVKGYYYLQKLPTSCSHFTASALGQTPLFIVASQLSGQCQCVEA